jgi:hypothetical protein
MNRGSLLLGDHAGRLGVSDTGDERHDLAIHGVIIDHGKATAARTTA